MKSDLLIERQQLLEDVLRYDSLSGGYFTVYQRMAINYERGCCFDQFNVLEGTLKEEEARNYQVPAHIEEKIIFITNKMYQ